MPESQHVECAPLDLVAHFIVPDQNATNLARLELFQLFTDTGLLQKADWRGGQRLHRARAG